MVPGSGTSIGGPASNSASPLSASGARRPAGYGASVSPGPASTARRKLATETEHMVHDIDTRVSQVMHSEGNRIRMCEDQLQRFTDGLQQMKTARSIEAQRRQQALTALHAKVTRELTGVKGDGSKFWKAVEERNQRHLDDIHKETSTTRTQALHEEQEYRSRVAQDIKQLESMMSSHSDSTIDYKQRIQSTLDQEFDTIERGIDEESKAREGTEYEMKRMVEDVRSRMRVEIEQERTQREEVQSRLLTLLEQTCDRIQNNIAIR